jgi:hypothetical protein
VLYIGLGEKAHKRRYLVSFRPGLISFPWNSEDERLLVLDRVYYLDLQRIGTGSIQAVPTRFSCSLRKPASSGQVTCLHHKTGQMMLPHLCLLLSWYHHQSHELKYMQQLYL